jgi:hypothetical protein
MADRPIRYRMNRVFVNLSDEELRDLRQVCEDLDVPILLVLMVGVRRARSVLNAERAKHQP